MSVPSYFPTVAATEKYVGKQYTSAVSIRPSDFRIMEHQRPVGWAFFAHSNVDFLLSQCRRVYAQIEFADISDVMHDIYMEYGADQFVEASLVRPMVTHLNELFFQRWSENRGQAIDGSRRYMDILGNPNPVARLPERVSKKDKTTLMSEHDLMTYSDNQGVHFDVNQDALMQILKSSKWDVASIDDPTQYRY